MNQTCLCRRITYTPSREKKVDFRKQETEEKISEQYGKTTNNQTTTTKQVKKEKS